MCARGYGNELSGLSADLIFAAAAISCIPIGLLTHKMGSQRTSLICKSIISVGLLGLAGVVYFLRYPNQTAGILISAIVAGAFAVGPYPIVLELVVECTYPIDQVTSTAFIYLSSAFQVTKLHTSNNVSLVTTNYSFSSYSIYNFFHHYQYGILGRFDDGPRKVFAY